MAHTERKNGNVRDIVTVKKTVGKCRVCFLSVYKLADGLNILDHGHNATCEHKQAREDREDANDIQANENV